MKIKNILFNKQYAKGSLYGVGVFPFWIYIKYFGKPVFKFCRRKLKLPRYWSIMASNILGSVAHVGFFLDGFNLKYIILFVGSLFIMTSLFWFTHILYQKGVIKLMS